MNERNEPGLGELLRYVSDLVEHGAEEHYRQMGLQYRARYTPVLRAIQAGAKTVTEITARTHLTQGAISQTVGHMENDGVISRHRVEDGRKSSIRLTPHGKELVAKLNQHWSATFAVIEELEGEIGHPLRRILEDAAKALERQGFAQRLTHIKLGQPRGIDQ
ncbi:MULTISPECIES: MarR family winged helix-turn-helix transcriptional regulator [Pseudomonadota]|mgnify:CR=1 FL=1|uniref:DNA-binding MarR family transcriptional regulator n=1 Tax=Gemmobacter caeni TaxID=589035 RepID=A0A2T6B8R0_9RHOB|nr:MULTISPECIES: MarR family winged helix-turn-helix transcriptional regulator [Pseudomonadota]EJU0637227.1 winged helix-turn-helix transcriptional regulator [Salmonella enterica]PTX52408.1 DNA-binding MarR family transcriptional regulator [Gemmobacter caeni]TWJ02921.1 DNA-binding MarR family transcriptional regulator [Gemmobacter caeni]